MGLWGRKRLDLVSKSGSSREQRNTSLIRWCSCRTCRRGQSSSTRLEPRRDCSGQCRPRAASSRTSARGSRERSDTSQSRRCKLELVERRRVLLIRHRLRSAEGPISNLSAKCPSNADGNPASSPKCGRPHLKSIGKMSKQCWRQRLQNKWEQYFVYIFLIGLDRELKYITLMKKKICFVPWA